MTSRNRLLSGFALVCCLVGNVTWAAEESDVNPSATATGSMDEIVVTARRKEESIENVPVAITAFSQATLKELAISNSYDLATTVPGLAVESDSGNSAIAQFSIRGRGQNYGSAAGSVETYFADVPLSGPFEMPQLPPQFFDLQSVQVLKGPQGTLFGRSTTGGAVLIVPQAPTSEFGGYGRIQAGDYNDLQVEGALNLPLMGDKAALRIAVFDWQRDGYQKTLGGVTDPYGYVLPSQTYENQDVKETRVTLLVRPIEGLENSTLFTTHTDGNRASQIANLLRVGEGSVPAPTLVTYGPRIGDFDSNLDKPESHIWAVINTTTYQLTDNLKLKNIFGYIHASGYTQDATDVDGTRLPGIDDVIGPNSRPRLNKQTTNEIQLQGSSLGSKLTWIVGGLLDQEREPWGPNQADIFNNTHEGAIFDTSWVQNTDNAYSAFGSATYSITDKLRVTGGLRNIWNSVKVLSTEQFTVADPQSYSPTNPIVSNSVKFNGKAYDVDVAYDLNPNALVYGGYRRGYKPGGFNSKSPSPSTAGFAPETVDDFNVGFKQKIDIGGMEGHFNIEGFYDLYHNAQRSDLTVVGAGLATVVYNVPSTIYRGFDTDFTLDTSRWLRLTLGYTFVDAYYAKWPDTTVPGETGNLAVNPVAYVSRNKAFLTARFHTDLPGNWGELAAAPTISYQDKSYTVDNGIRLQNGEAAALGGPFCAICAGGVTIPSYTLVNLRLEWNKIMGSKVDLGASVTNLTNKVFLTGASETLVFGFNGVSYGPPRMFLVEARSSF
jgi:iron complex outermembrane receptor protein